MISESKKKAVPMHGLSLFLSGGHVSLFRGTRALLVVMPELGARFVQMAFSQREECQCIWYLHYFLIDGIKLAAKGAWQLSCIGTAKHGRESATNCF